jgi:hypothetical protein
MSEPSATLDWTMALTVVASQGTSLEMRSWFHPRTALRRNLGSARPLGTLEQLETSLSWTAVVTDLETVGKTLRCRRPAQVRSSVGCSWSSGALDGGPAGWFLGDASLSL